MNYGYYIVNLYENNYGGEKLKLSVEVNYEANISIVFITCKKKVFSRQQKIWINKQILRWHETISLPLSLCDLCERIIDLCQYAKQLKQEIEYPLHIR